MLAYQKTIIVISQAMKRTGIIFARIENFKKFKFPLFIKDILKETGFNTAAALKTIKESSIGKLERFVSNRLDLLRKTDYVNATGNLKQSPFRFLLGHEALILNLPNEVEDYLREKGKKKDIPAIEDLKLSFNERIKKFADKNKLTISTDKIIITHSNKQVKCFIKCPFCESKLSCTFDSSWKLSNYKKHILRCAKKIDRQPNPRPNLFIQRAEPNAALRALKNALP